MADTKKGKWLKNKRKRRGGSVIKRHGAWYLRLCEKIMEEAPPSERQPWKWQARVEDYSKMSNV